MKTLILKNPGAFEVIETPEPGRPGQGEVLVRVHHVGLCGTDIHAYAGRQPFFTYPRILGHELGVEVLEVGAGVKNLAVGDHCAVEPYLAHPGDRAFARGKTNCSASTQCLGVHVDGGMREMILLPAEKLHPADLETEKLALVETLCIGHHAVRRAMLTGDEKIVVIGLGPIGLTVIQSLLLEENQMEVFGLDIDEGRLETCKSLYPKITTLKIKSEILLSQQWTGWQNQLPDAVFDCTGNPASMEAAIGLPANGGQIILVGLCKGEIKFDDPSFHRRELTILSSRNAVASDFQRIMDAIEDGRIRTDAWITHRAHFDELPDCIDKWLQPGSGLLKGVISF